MREQFTKGEWVVKDIEAGEEYIRIRGSVLGGRFKIANVCNENKHHDDSDWCKRERDESLANAHLIAQAPAMYEMLKVIDTCIADSKNEIELADMVANLCHDIDQLLAKALGVTGEDL